MKKYCTCLFFIIFLTHYVSAQIAEIPFTIEGNHMLIEVYDSKGVKRDFMFDTGAEPTLLDATLAKNNGLQPDGYVEVTGANDNKSLAYVSNQTFSLTDKIILKKIHVILSDLSTFKNKFDGVIGYDLLEKYVVKIDYIHKKLLFYKRIKELSTSGYTAIPFRFWNDTYIAQFDISMVLQSGSVLKGRILFDTGAGLTLKIGEPFAKKNNLSEKIGKTVEGSARGLHSASSHKLASVKEVRIDTFSLKDMIVQVSTNRSGVSGNADYMGIMGNVIISRFDIILDYRKKMLYLKPNAQFYNPFTYAKKEFTQETKEE